MADREEIVCIARRWIGTPYRHQASRRGVGADCLGLVRGVWRELLGDEPEPAPAYSMDWSEPQGEERLWQAAARLMIEISPHNCRPGDVVLFRMRSGSVAKHLAIASDLGADARFIHAYSGHGVVESPLSQPWRRRIVACFQFPEEAS